MSRARQLADAVPSGAVLQSGDVGYFAMNTAPNGWLKANGAAVSRTTYAALFAAIGTTFGAGNGSTTFNLPDLRGEFLRGWDDGRGLDSGRVFGTAQLDQMQRITGSFGTTNWKGISDPANTTGSFSGSGGQQQGPDGSGGANTLFRRLDFDSANSPNARVSATTNGETRSRNIALLACIKF